MFARRIDERMRKRELTDRDVAKVVGVAHSQVYSWRIGKTRPQSENLDLLCVALGVDADYLFGRDDRAEPVMRTVRSVFGDAVADLVAALAHEPLDRRAVLAGRLLERLDTLRAPSEPVPVATPKGTGIVADPETAAELNEEGGDPNRRTMRRRRKRRPRAEKTSGDDAPPESPHR